MAWSYIENMRAQNPLFVKPYQQSQAIPI